MPSEAKRLRAAGVASALAGGSLPNTCSGAVVTNKVYACKTPSNSGPDKYTIKLGQASDVLFVRATASDGAILSVTVTGPHGTPVDCLDAYETWIPRCAIKKSGTYGLEIESGSDGPYLLSTKGLLSDTSCSTVDPSFSAPTLSGSIAAGAVGACYAVPVAKDNVLHVDEAFRPDTEAMTPVFDAVGSQVCADVSGADCKLTGMAPYRVLVSPGSYNAVKYRLNINTVSHPHGCLSATQQAYGTVPALDSTVRCRAVYVSAPGRYWIDAVGAENSGVAGGTLYKPNGTAMCTGPDPTCTLAVGHYYLVASVWPWVTPRVGVVFTAANDSRGCMPMGDTGFASGSAKAAFDGPNELVCRTLPTVSGKTDYMFDEPPADGVSPQMQVIDATGAQQCPDANFDYAICSLHGTAPFRVVLTTQSSHASYNVLVQRSDKTAGCSAWPQSDFGGSWGAEVSLTATNMVGCLSIPAAQHSTSEMVDYTNTANTANGVISVYDPAGTRVCSGDTAGMCSYKAGVTYTALVSTTSSADTYKVVRRDVSSTAHCSSPVSTTVGGPSTAHNLTSALYAVCERLTGAVTDKFWVDARTTQPDGLGKALIVTDADGTSICFRTVGPCKVTGSTKYQVIVVASNYSGSSISTHVDTWRVGTAAGWAPQCTAHHLSVDGFGPISGTLTETSTAYCAVIQLKSLQEFNVYGSGTVLPGVSVFESESWTPYSFDTCSDDNLGTFHYRCATSPSDPGGEAVFLVTPYASKTPLHYYLQGVCRYNCVSPGPATIDSVSPSSGPAGGVHTVVVHGTNLNMGTEVSLASGGLPANGYYNDPVSVNAAGTALTIQLSTFDLQPGTYDVVLDHVWYTTGEPSQGYLPGAYHVTPGPTPTPTPSP